MMTNNNNGANDMTTPANAHILAEIAAAMNGATKHGQNVSVALGDCYEDEIEIIILIDGAAKYMLTACGGGWHTDLATPLCWRGRVGGCGIQIPSGISPRHAGDICRAAIDSHAPRYFVTGHDWDGAKKRIDVSDHAAAVRALGRDFYVGSIWRRLHGQRRQVKQGLPVMVA